MIYFTGISFRKFHDLSKLAKLKIHEHLYSLEKWACHVKGMVELAHPTMATLFKYFKKHDDSPDPKGPLSSKVPSSSILAANKDVKTVLQDNVASVKTTKKHTQGSYDRFTLEEKAIIAQKASEISVTKMVNKYNKDLQNCNLKESTVRIWVTEYKRELE